MIPAVEGLLPEPHNSMVVTLLYRLAEWHALAKLRMHTERTLECLEKSTTIIGRELRNFRNASAKSFTCQELPKETTARQRRRERTQAQRSQPNSASINVNGTSSNMGISNPQLHAGGDTQDTSLSKDAPPLVKLKPKLKTLNLFTYKFHALGDYVRSIRLFGTTDSYSTQIVSTTLFFVSRR